MAQLLTNEDEVLEAYDPSIAASRRFKFVEDFDVFLLNQKNFSLSFLDIQLPFSSI